MQYRVSKAQTVATNASTAFTPLTAPGDFFFPAHRIAIGDVLVFRGVAVSTVGEQTALESYGYSLALDGPPSPLVDPPLSGGIINISENLPLIAGSPFFDVFGGALIVGNDGKLYQAATANPATALDTFGNVVDNVANVNLDTSQVFYPFIGGKEAGVEQGVFNRAIPHRFRWWAAYAVGGTGLNNVRLVHASCLHLQASNGNSGSAA